MLRRVDFPLPEGPMMAKNSPASTSKETSSSAWVYLAGAVDLAELFQFQHFDAPLLLQVKAIDAFQSRVVGNDCLFADGKSAQHFDLLGIPTADFDGSAKRRSAILGQYKNPVAAAAIQKCAGRKNYRRSIGAER